MNTRQQDIVKLLEKCGELTIKTLSECFGVTEMTIHRDLDLLEKERYLYKKRGAAVYVNSPDRNTDGFYADEKRSIGKKAASLIKPGQSVIFDNSTTALETARFLDGIPNLTFYTTNLETSSVLAQYKNTVLHCSGGYYFSDSKGFVGKQAEDFVRNIRADVCVIGASGISVERGLTNPYSVHTVLQRLIIESANKHIVVADHSKFGKIAMEKAAELSEIECIVTDSALRQELFLEYSKYTEIIMA